MADERQKYDDKLALILRTAAVVFASRGYHQASIRDISRATGISLSGLYYYFRSKEELLFLIQDHCFATVVENLERRLEGVVDPVQRFQLMVDNHLRFFVNNMDEMKVLSHEAEALTGDFRQGVNARKKRYTELCREILEGLPGATPAVTTRTATFALFGMMNWIYNWYSRERDVSVEDLIEEVTQLFLHGYLGDARGAQPALPASADHAASPSIWRV